MSTLGCPAFRSRLHGAVRVVLLILLVSPLGVVRADPPDVVPVWAAYAEVDGTAIDLDVDGEGDLVDDAVGSVLVGWNAGYWPGEDRGVYEFDVRSAPRPQVIARAFLYLNCIGHYLNGEALSHQLSLYAGPGNGLVENEDFQAGAFVTEFDALDACNPFEWHEKIDVSRVVRHLIYEGAQDLVFVVHPDPGESANRGGILFGSYELSLSDDYLPAMLVIEGPTKKKKTEQKPGSPGLPR